MYPSTLFTVLVIVLVYPKYLGSSLVNPRLVSIGEVGA